MAQPEYIIGIDIGTTSTKVILFANDGALVNRQTMHYPLRSPHPDIKEQDPKEIYRAVIQGVCKITTEQPAEIKNLIGLSFSTAMHSIMAVDDQGELLTNSITWADRRAAPWADKLRQHCDGHALYRRTGVPIHPMSPLTKIMWLREDQPELFQKAAKFISIKEYILYRWFGEYVVDYSIANTSGLFNLNTFDWDGAALTFAGIDASRLSQLVPTTHILKSMDAEAASCMGIPVDLPVVMGASDGALANLGVGAIAPNTVTVTVGTSGAVRAMLCEPKTDPKERLFCYTLTEDYWVVGGATNNGGIILRWAKDTLASSAVNTAELLQQDPYDILTAIAATIPPGSARLIFHPYLAGERSPLWDANARGSFFGLELNHTKAHMIRAVLEGVVYNLNAILTALEETVGPATSIQATGGFARSDLWRQMLADVFNQPVTIPEVYEGSCFGAAVLGLYALERIPNLEQVSSMIKVSQIHKPIPENVERYQIIIPLYQQLLDSLLPFYQKLKEIP
ncbi:MAG: gluconokinase [Phormidesmis sp.]